ncbi:YceI family protein [Hymenobacter psoromatis]|uniref:YceI family protein n=1 Tax=Hymenobacter psoromatis TaxID=1484116 RepID=UPI001CBC9D13|nr:YceI family protein [Hymenobacter psoromatis]
MSTTTATKWVLDPTHSEVHFKIKHLVISTVTGSFKTFAGTMQSAGDSFENAQVELTLNVDSIDTNNAQRDEHLRSELFFEAPQFPQIKFASTSFTKSGEGEYQLIGELTIRNTTKSVTLSVEHGGTAVDFSSKTRAGFEAAGKINRKEYGLTWGGVTEAGAIVLGDEVKLALNVQFIKQVD